MQLNYGYSTKVTFTVFTHCYENRLSCIFQSDRSNSSQSRKFDQVRVPISRIAFPLPP